MATTLDDRRLLGVWQAFLQAHSAVVEALEEDLVRSHRLPLTWFEVLLRLADEPEWGLRMQDLAARALLSKSGLTRLVDRMEAAGLVQRASCPHDRRGTFAVITEEGRKVLLRARPLVVSGIEEHFLRHLSQAELKSMANALAKVLDAHGQPGPSPSCTLE